MPVMKFVLISPEELKVPSYVKQGMKGQGHSLHPDHRSGVCDAGAGYFIYDPRPAGAVL